MEVAFLYQKQLLVEIHVPSLEYEMAKPVLHDDEFLINFILFSSNVTNALHRSLVQMNLIEPLLLCF